jgi:hypothetical protein
VSRWVGTIVGFSTAAVFVAIGIGLLSEDRDRLGALLMALGVLRAVVAVRQLVTAAKTPDDAPTPPG